MKLTGWRKFTAFVLSLSSFTAIAILKEVDLFNLGLAITGLLAAFGGSNVFEHYAKSKKPEA